jgi:hypothetical protein
MIFFPITLRKISKAKRKMKSILVPTDFSPVANYVLPLAEELAHKENSRFSMVHAYDGNYTSMLPSYRDFAVHKMNGLLQSNHLEYLPHRCYVREGSMGNCIEHLTREQPISLVVMGKNGAEEDIESEIVFRSACPVLAIPQGTLKDAPSHIVYLTSHVHEEIYFLRLAAHFASLFQSHLTILNVQNQGIDENYIDKMRSIIIDLDHHKISHEYITAENLVEGLKKYMQYKKPDIVAVAGTSGGWFNNKRKQYLKQLLTYPGLPLLFINAENKKTTKFHA